MALYLYQRVPLIICRQSILGDSLNKRSQADPLTRVRMSHKYYYYADMLRLLTPGSPFIWRHKRNNFYTW